VRPHRGSPDNDAARPAGQSLGSAVLVTGATGTVGHPIAERLAAEGHRVRALVRSTEKARPILPVGVEAIEGDVTDAASVRRAIAGCEVVYHTAGLPEQWLPDSDDFARVNLGGTRNMVDAALEAGVERFVYTSTIDVFAAPPGEPFDESVLDPEPRPTVYERSKQDADRYVAAAVERGLPAVFLRPAAVYGPAPQLVPPVNDLIRRLAQRKVPVLLPGGMPLALASEPVARLAGRPPIVQRGDLHFLAWRPHPSARRAQDDLGWAATPLAEGLERTIDHFRAKQWI
jgi:dihydroflavonol-4-reductase